jgi:hypothetical protein
LGRAARRALKPLPSFAQAEEPAPAVGLRLNWFRRSFGAILSVFNSADFHVGARMSSSGAGGPRGRDTPTDDLAGSLGLSCVRGARRDVTEDGDTSDRGAA